MTVFAKRKQGQLGGLSDRTSDIILVIFSLIILLIIAYPLYYVLAQGYDLDITDQRLHHEIYLSDARKVAPERLKTVIRHPIKEQAK